MYVMNCWFDVTILKYISVDVCLKYEILHSSQSYCMPVVDRTDKWQVLSFFSFFINQAHLFLISDYITLYNRVELLSQPEEFDKNRPFTEGKKCQRQGKKVYALSKMYALCSCYLSSLYATQHICKKAWLNTLTVACEPVKVNVPKWWHLILYIYYYSPMYYIFCYTDCAVWVSAYPMYIWMLQGWWLPQWYSAEMSCHVNNC